MIRAVLDTNVIVAGLLKPAGTPGKLLRLLQAGAYKAVFSAELVDEIASVWSYPKIMTKYRKGTKDIEEIAALFALRGDFVKIEERIRVCRDPQDDFLIETAISGNADYIVTGDLDLLTVPKVRRIRMIRPETFLKLLENPKA